MSPKAANMIQSLLDASESKDVQRFTYCLSELTTFIDDLEERAGQYDAFFNPFKGHEDD